MRTKRMTAIVMAALAITIAVAVFVLQTVATDKSRQGQQTSTASTAQKADKTTVSYQGKEGKTALELLKDSHEIKTETYEGFGELVTSIDGVSADSKHFWAFYVNGKESQVGASTYKAKSTDKITWKLEEIK